MSHIKLNLVSVHYGTTIALENISGTFKSGSLTAVAGTNGAGKSTLLKAIMGELPLSNGTIDCHSRITRDIAYLPQATDIDRNFPLNVEDLVSLGTWRTNGAFRQLSKSCLTSVQDALIKVGLQGHQKRQMCELSAGQFQRVLFARLLLQNTSVILLDEPFTAIDEKTTQDLLNIVMEWHQAGRTIIAVLHDLQQIQSHFPETLQLAKQQLYWGKSTHLFSPMSLTSTPNQQRINHHDTA